MTGVTTPQQNPKILLTIPTVIKNEGRNEGTTVGPGVGHNVGTETGQNPKSEVGNGVGTGVGHSGAHDVTMKIKQEVHVKQINKGKETEKCRPCVYC